MPGKNPTWDWKTEWFITILIRHSLRCLFVGIHLVLVCLPLRYCMLGWWPQEIESSLCWLQNFGTPFLLIYDFPFLSLCSSTPWRLSSPMPLLIEVLVSFVFQNNFHTYSICFLMPFCYLFVTSNGHSLKKQLKPIQQITFLNVHKMKQTYWE